MDNKRIARQLVKLAKVIIGSGGMYFFYDKNGLVVWTDSVNNVNHLVDILDKVSYNLDTTDDYFWLNKSQASQLGLRTGWGWYGLFGVAKKVGQELKKNGFVEKKPQ